MQQGSSKAYFCVPQTGFVQFVLIGRDLFFVPLKVSCVCGRLQKHRAICRSHRQRQPIFACELLRVVTVDAFRELSLALRAPILSPLWRRPQTQDTLSSFMKNKYASDQERNGEQDARNVSMPYAGSFRIWGQALLPLSFPPVRIQGVNIQRNLLITQCAWCKRDVRLSLTPGDACITHGICPSCREAMETL